MTILNEYLINNRSLTYGQKIGNPQLFNRNKNYLFDLSYLSLFDLNGDNATEFLQGQLTCDVHQISDIKMLQGAQCNLKGRILSLLDIISWNGIKLILPKDLIESTINSLSKTAMLSRVSIKPDDDYNIFGFYLQNPDDLLPDASFYPKDLYAFAYDINFSYYHLGHGFYVFIVAKQLAAEWTNRFIQKDQFEGSLSWHTLRLLHNQFEIYPESRALFLPHRLDLQKTPYLSFDKGCYKGQEIIARTHYKATLKHEFKLFNIVTKERLYSGQKLFKIDNNMEFGELIDYSYLGDNHYIVAVSVLMEPISIVRFEGHAMDLKLESGVL